jgi:hypothetical protein
MTSLEPGSGRLSEGASSQIDEAWTARLPLMRDAQSWKMLPQIRDAQSWKNIELLAPGRSSDRSNRIRYRGVTNAARQHVSRAIIGQLHRHRAPQASVRRLICELSAGKQPCTRAFRPKAEYRARVGIGYAGPGFVSADTPFDESKLTPSDAGHYLKLIFSTLDQSLAQTGYVFLPASQGESTLCAFDFRTEDAGMFQGQIIVLHENRIVQTALLRGQVRTHPKSNDHIELVIQAELRPNLKHLENRAPFDAALLLQQSDPQSPPDTAIAGSHAATISLAQLRKVARVIEERLNTVEWLSKDYRMLRGKGTTGLLRFLALHGSSMYQALVEDRLIGAELAQAKRLQAVAREEAHIPLEFIYSGAPPKDNARICSVLNRR